MVNALSALGDETLWVQRALPQVQNEHDLLTYQCLDAMFRQLDLQRKRENALLQARVKAWEIHKRALRPQILSVVKECGGQTLLGTTYRSEPRQEFRVDYHDADLAMQWLSEVFPQGLSHNPTINEDGKACIEKALLDGVAVPGVAMYECEPIAATRFRGPVDMQTLLGQETLQQALAAGREREQITEGDEDPEN